MNQKTETLRDVAERIIRDASPATASGATCFVPRYQIDQLQAALAAEKAKAPSYDALLLIAQSVCGALGRAGVTDCDDPGEAIDVLRERWERNVVPNGYVLVLREPSRAMQDAGMDAARMWFGEEIARSGITRASAIGFFKAMIGARPAGCCAGECDGACDGTPNPCGVTDQQCEAIFRAVSLATLTRDVKSPERMRQVVREAITSGAHGVSEVPEAGRAG